MGGPSGPTGPNNPDNNGPGDSIGVTPIIDGNGDLIVVECPEGQEPNYFGLCEAVEEDQIINELTDPCASLIFSQLTLLSTSFDIPSTTEEIENQNDRFSLSFTQDILNLFNRDILYDYIVYEDSSLPNNTSAQTNPQVYFNSETLRHEINTRFNPDYLNNASRLSITRTMIHESLHAFLIYEQDSNPLGNFHTSLNNYARSTGNSGSGNIIHHNFMAQFVNAMAYNLKLWDHNHGTGGNLGWQYYHDMAWGGLINYEDPNTGEVMFYEEYIDHNPNQTDRERIENTVQNESTNNSDAIGGDC